MDGFESFNRSGGAFMVRLSPVGRFYHGLAVMKKISESAVLMLRSEEVELRVSDPSGAGIASMIIDASAEFPSYSSRSFAFRFYVMDLMYALGSSVSESDSRSLWITKMNKPGALLVIGMGSSLENFFEVEEITPFTSDLRDLQLMPCGLTLPSKYLREAITACDSDENADFHLSYTFDRVTWTISNSETVHHIKDEKCVVGGVAPGVERRIVVEWMGFEEALAEASREAGVVTMSPMSSPWMSNWISFLFRFDEGSRLMILLRGMKHLCSSPVAEYEHFDSSDDDGVFERDDEDEDEDSDSKDDEDEDEDSDNKDDEDEYEDSDNNDVEDEDEDSDNNDDEDVDLNGGKDGENDVHNIDDEDEDEDSDSNDDEDVDLNDGEDGEKDVHNNDDEDEDEDSDNNDDEDENEDPNNNDDEDGDVWILV